MKPIGQKGFVLGFVVLVSLVLGMLSTSWLLKGDKAARSRESQSRRSDLANFKLALIKLVDCAQSVSPITPATQCRTVPAGGLGAPVTLRSKSGTTIAPANLRGQFGLRAYCRERANSSGTGTGQYYLYVQSQLFKKSGQLETDPTLKLPLDYSHPSNQLFTEADLFCTSALAGGAAATPTVTTYYKKVTAPFVRGTTVPVQPNGGAEHHTSNGAASGSGDCFLGGTHGNDYQIPTLRPNATNPSTTASNWYSEIGDGGWGGRRTRVIFGYRWRSNPRCPAGYKAIAGGANCKAFDGYSWLRNGLVVGSRPDDDGNGWIVQCCGRDHGIAAGGQHPTINSWVGCILESGPP